MKQQSENSELHVLVVGCGSIGSRHIGNLLALGVGKVTAVDPDPDRRAKIESSFGIPVVSDMDNAWKENPTIVVVATPTQSHIPVAMEAATHDCHLFIEKPLSYSLDDVGTLCEEIDQRGLITMIGCNMRFHFGPFTTKRKIDDGAIGHPLAARLQCGSYLPNWRPHQDYRESYSAHPEWGGAVLDCIHEIDLALWYLGPASLQAAVCADAQSIGLTTDGIAELILRHENGSISNVHLNFVQRDYRRTCQIIGTDGTLYWDEETNDVVTYLGNGIESDRDRCPEQWKMDQMYVEEMAHFLWAVRTGSPTANSVRESTAALTIATKAREAGECKIS